LTDADLLTLPDAQQAPNAEAAARQEPESLEVASLRHDVECTLIQLLRERTSGRVLLESTDDAKTLAATLAPLLAKRVGGRYVPKHDGHRLREALDRRNEGIRRDFNGRNREEVMTRYGVSSRVLYYVVSQGRRKK
jgi:Mor family transcriptional regulator